MTSSTLIKLFAVMAAYFSPITLMLHIVLIFIAIDFLTGIYGSYRKKTPIISSRLRKTIEKFVFYIGAIIIAWMFQIQFADWTNLAQLVGGFIAATELLSIYENITAITGLNLIAKVKSILTDIIKQRTNKQ